MRRISAILMIFSIFLTSACSGPLGQLKPNPVRKRTVVLFLIDGLSVPALQNALATDSMSAFRNHFFQQGNRFNIARAAFPTLTLPNVSSILTGRPIGEQPILGNKMLIQSRVVNFEDPRFRPALARYVDSDTVFETLNRQGKTSASFSFTLGQNATTHTSAGITEAIEYKLHDYDEIDDRLIRSTQNYLESHDPSEWPEFIYIHLIGVDGYMHHLGPNDRRTVQYLQSLSTRLAPVFKKLQEAESHEHDVVTFLTSDHGSVDTPQFADVEEEVRRIHSSATVLNQGRILSVYSEKSDSPEKLQNLLARVRHTRGVDMTVYRDRGGAIRIDSAHSLASIRQNHPFVMENLTAYFNADQHPDAIVLAQDGFTFSNKHRGDHGGLSASEVYVPLLMRNASLSGNEIPRTSDLLRFLQSRHNRL